MKTWWQNITLYAVAIALTSFYLGSYVRAFQTYPSMSEAASRIDKQLESLLTAQGLKLSADARAVIRQDILVREMSKGTLPEQISFSPKEAQALRTTLGGQTASFELDSESVRTLLANEKVQSVQPTFRGDVQTQAGLKGVTLTPDAEKAIVDDLLRNSMAMARSGLATDQIVVMNRQYLDQVYKMVKPGVTLAQGVYSVIRADIFSRIVHLTIETTPPGAIVKVMVDQVPQQLGKTTIENKPFQPGKEYVFLFELSGYKPAKRVYSISPGVDEQAISEVLVKE